MQFKCNTDANYTSSFWIMIGWKTTGNFLSSWHHVKYDENFVLLNRTFDGTLNSPNERNKTLCFVHLVCFIFKLQNSRSRQTLKNSHTTKILVTSKNCHLILARVRSIFGIAREYYTNTGGVGENSLTLLLISNNKLFLVQSVITLHKELKMHSLKRLAQFQLFEKLTSAN